MQKFFRVLLIEDNPADARLFREHLASSGSAAFTLEWADRLSAGIKRLCANDIDLVLLDLMLPDSRGFETFSALRAAAPGIPVILLTGLEDEVLAIRAVREGAQDFLVKGDVNSNSLVRAMRYAIERHRQSARADSETARRAGKVFAFLGAKGGVGATSVLLNIASIIASQGKSVIAAEIRPSQGSFGFQLKENPALNLSALLKADIASIANAELLSHLYRMPSNLRVLFGPQTPEEFAEIPPEQAELLARRLAGEAEYVFLDLPSQPSLVHQAVLRACDSMSLIIEAEPVCFASARTWMATLSAWGIGSAMVSAIVNNRVLLSNPMRFSDIKLQLDCNVLGVIPPAPDAFVLAHTSGVPLAIARPESNAASVLSDLAGRFASEPVLARA